MRKLHEVHTEYTHLGTPKTEEDEKRTKRLLELVGRQFVLFLRQAVNPPDPPTKDDETVNKQWNHPPKDGETPNYQTATEGGNIDENKNVCHHFIAHVNSLTSSSCSLVDPPPFG